MSAMKKHQLWEIVHASTDVVVNNDEGEQLLQLKSMLISRKVPNQCQVFCESESVGSIAGNSTSVFNGKIIQAIPKANHTNYEIDIKVGDKFQTLNVKSVKSQNKECTIC